MPRTSSPNGTARPLSLGPYPGVTSASTTMDITTIDGELSSHSPTTMYTSITAGPYPGVTHALTTTDIAIIAGNLNLPLPALNHEQVDPRGSWL
ncbi:glycophorin-C isoform X17 [Macaca fascicularis]|uniref:glycophorin-C isoform X17 n=1 Tax=Macaca fascicularis TaxID=9541 RepID=UPI003D154506